jgi:hypothetical protein
MKKFISFLISIPFFASFLFSQQVEKFNTIYSSSRYNLNPIESFLPIAILDSNNIIASCVINYLWDFESIQEIQLDNKFGIYLGRFLLKTTNGGYDWHLIKSEIPKFKDKVFDLKNDNAYKYNGLAYPDKNTILCYGAYRKWLPDSHYVDPWYARIIKSEDAGVTWKEIVFPNVGGNCYCRDLKMINNKEGYCFVSQSIPNNSIKLLIYYTDDNWESYRSIYENDFNTYKLVNNSLFTTNKKYIQFNNGNTVIFTNDSKNWENIEIDTNYTIIQVEMIDEFSGILAVQDKRLKNTDSSYKILRTKNKFKTLQTIPINYRISRILSISVFDENHYMIRGIIYDKNFLFTNFNTTDGGKSWEILYFSSPLQQAGSLEFLGYIDSDQYLIAGRGFGDSYLYFKSNFYRSSKYKNLKPTIPFLDGITNKYKFDNTTDTIKWEKIIGAEKYRIFFKGQYYQDDLKFPKVTGLEFPINMRNEDKLSIVTKDTFFVVKDLWHRASYEISLFAFNDGNESNTVKNYYFKLDSGYLQTPIILEPKKSNDSKYYFKDSLKFVWNKVESATGYDLLLYESNPNLVGANIKSYRFALTNYQDTSVTVYDLIDNTDYIFTVSAVSNDDHSFFTSLFMKNEYPDNIIDYSISNSSLSPNPVSDYARLKLDNDYSGIVSISIVDLLGNTTELYKGEISRNMPLDLDFFAFPTGFYSLIIDYGTKREVVKVIKQ